MHVNISYLTGFLYFLIADQENNADSQYLEQRFPTILTTKSSSQNSLKLAM
jgi:hypothetical protein